MAKSELGTKRIDPETGRKFYDLNKDPIVSPYTGKTYPRSYFEDGNDQRSSRRKRKSRKRKSTPRRKRPRSFRSRRPTRKPRRGDELPDLDDDEDDVDLGDDDDDTFLAEEEEEDDDVADIIGVGDDDDEI